MIDTNKKESGFSLTEMSIVIMVMALLAAASFQGKNMIEAAKIRAIISEVSEYKIALNSFYTKYEKLPGDFDEAVAYWGAGTNADGDGDGKIEFVITAPDPDVYEGYRAWQHLSYAKMVNAAFLGTQTTGAATLDTDAPKSSHKGGYFLEYGVFALTYDNVLVLGAPLATTSAPILTGGVLTPGQAIEIDTKSDDGEPGTGHIRGKDASGSAAESCVNDVTDDNGAAPNDNATSDDFYKIAVSGADCILGFKMLEQ